MKRIVLFGVMLAAIALIAPSAPAHCIVGVETYLATSLRIEGRRLGFNGTITAITHDSITITGCGPQRVGRGNAVKRVKRFVASDCLAKGGFPIDLGGSTSYRLSDIRVGDRVSVFYNRIDGQDICTHVCIQRRPGGRVPPSRWKPPGTRFAWHEWANAQQDLEEKGIPIPAKFALPPPSVPSGK